MSANNESNDPFLSASVIAGTSIPIVEGVVAVAHGGVVGGIVGLGVSGLVYLIADEMAKKGRGVTLPAAALPAKKVRQPGEHSFLWRAFNGKDSREEEYSARSKQHKKLLVLSPDYQPHTNHVLGHCILCVGQRGTGKSNVAARLIEQIGQHPIPMSIFDYKMDYVTLPTVLERCLIAGSGAWKEKDTYADNGYWELDRDNAEDAGYTILANGVQMVFQVISYENINQAAEVMLGIIKGMFAWAQEQPAGKRIPALIVLDEAQQFLPQNQGISQIDRGLSMQAALCI